MFDETEMPELPELLQAEWDRDHVLALFSDLAAGAEVTHVQLRTDDSDRSVDLTTAAKAFADGSARAIQVRYRFDGESWSDTLIPADPTTRVIRNRLPV